MVNGRLALRTLFRSPFVTIVGIVSLALVMRQVALITGIGGAIGIAGALGLGRLSQSLLFEMKGTDPLVFTLAGVVLGLVAFAAGYIPARRAASIDPMRALRYE